MAVWITLGALGVVWGVVFLFLGWRGKRTGAVRRCRRCDFELTGLGEGVASCPECGRSIAVEKGVVIGTRRRRGWMMAVGAVVLVAGLLVGGGAVASTQVQVTAYMPYWMLERLGRVDDSQLGTDALVELRDRLERSELSASEVDALLSLALDVQGDLEEGVTWRQEWSDILGAAWQMGLLSDGETLRYFAQALELRLRVRDRVIAGRYFHIGVKIDAARLEWQSGMSVARKRILLPPIVTKLHRVDEAVEFRSTHPRSPMYWTSYPTVHLTKRGTIEMLSDFPAGKAVVSARVLMAIVDPSMSEPYPDELFDLDEQPPAGTIRVVKEMACEVDVMPADTPFSEFVTPEFSENETEFLSEHVRIETIEELGQDAFAVEVVARSSAIPLAFDVVLKGTGEAGDGKVASSIYVRPGVMHSSTFTFQRGLLGGSDAIDVLLRPSAEVAYREPEGETYFGGEIRFEDVPLPHGQVTFRRVKAKPTRIERYEPSADR